MTDVYLDILFKDLSAKTGYSSDYLWELYEKDVEENGECDMEQFIAITMEHDWMEEDDYHDFMEWFEERRAA